MSEPAAALFRTLQRAGFYEALHRVAVRTLPAGDGATWLDMGCGPGLVVRLAAAHGYRAIGIDRDASMIGAARRDRRNRQGEFRVGGLDTLGGIEAADVVSATSLLCTLADPVRGVAQLWGAVRPGGRLLVVETTAAMSLPHLRRRGVRTHPGLALWAAVRGGRAVDPAPLHRLGAEVSTVPLLHGMVEAIVVTSAR